jgi:hypothetical protein
MEKIPSFTLQWAILPLLSGSHPIDIYDRQISKLSLRLRFSKVPKADFMVMSRYVEERIDPERQIADDRPTCASADGRCRELGESFRARSTGSTRSSFD